MYREKIKSILCFHATYPSERPLNSLYKKQSYWSPIYEMKNYLRLDDNDGQPNPVFSVLW